LKTLDSLKPNAGLKRLQAAVAKYPEINLTEQLPTSYPARLIKM
jgi:hypothetical protein